VQWELANEQFGYFSYRHLNQFEKTFVDTRYFEKKLCFTVANIPFNFLKTSQAKNRQEKNFSHSLKITVWLKETIV